MDQAEIDLNKIESTLRVNTSALDSSEQMLRQMKMFKIWPETQSESILFSGVDIDKEIKRVTDHILHLMERIAFADTLMFKHKLVHGEDE